MIFALSASEWQDMSDVSSLMAIVSFIVAGLLLGYALRGLVGRWQAEAIEKKMRMRLDETEAEAKARLKEADLMAKAEVMRAREEFERSTEAKKKELAQAEERLAAREAKLDERKDSLEQRSAQLDEKATALEDAKAQAKRDAQEIEEKKAEAVAKLEELARMTHEEAKRTILDEERELLREDIDTFARRAQENARDEAEERAQKLVADALRRTAIDHIAEMTTTTVPLPNEEMKGRIVGQGGRNVRAFEAATGVNLLLDDAPGAVTLSSFDALRREVAKKALEALVADGRIHPSSIEATVAACREAVLKENREAASEAAAEVGVIGLSAEIMRTMGALRFRTSYSQNVLRHSVEVALLAGAIASEMGADATLARRAGFLHDIGKVLTADKKGAHAALGAQFLRERGEGEVVCKAVAAHHGEGKEDGGVVGAIVAAADAISSARPGARQETLGEYIQRVQDVEAIAKAHHGVTQAFAVQAGRDLRVMVDPSKVGDLAASETARAICREISSRIRFPGQIRVTVIRELRTTEYAK
ncbi:MAG: ribonuclease Y [Kiritimatiellae bacterium]|nr:ribonuclease Y [Kiritimatiellia bacterium]